MAKRHDRTVADLRRVSVVRLALLSVVVWAAAAVAGPGAEGAAGSQESASSGQAQEQPRMDSPLRPGDLEPRLTKDTDDFSFEQVPLNLRKPELLRAGPGQPEEPAELLSPFTPSNVNVSNLFGNESEVSIAINPTNRRNMVIVGHSPGAAAMNTFFSTDGGQNWTLVPLGQAQDGQANCNRTDPTVAFDANGTVYAGYFTFNCTGTTRRMLFVARSTDGGQTYPQITTAVNDPTGGLDKEILGVGRDPVTATQQNVYVAYRLDVGADVQIHVTTSTDGGATFPTDVIINDDSIAGNDFASFGMPAVGPNGELYVVWDDFSNNPTSSRIMVDRSFDGGVTWGTDVQIATTGVTRGNANGLVPSGATRYHIPAQPDRGVLAVPSIAVDRTGGPNNGRLYVTYTVVGGGGAFNTDVVLRTSDDDGATWSAPRTVNDDGGTLSQFLPWVAVDNCGSSLGRVVVTWYDARNHGPNQRVENFLGVSEDGGVTFQPNVRVSAGRSDQSTANPARSGNNYLEYIGVDACNNVACTVWADNSASAADLDFFSDCVPITTADLSVAKIGAPDPATTGGTLTYVITVTNSGPDAATAVRVVDTLPASGYSFTSASAGCSVAAGVVTCDVGDLAVGASVSRAITGLVDCALADGTLLTNAAFAMSIAVDPDTSDNSATIATLVSNPPPVLICPADVSRGNDPGQCSAVVSYPPPALNDNCPGATAACVPASGSIFPVGVSPILCTAVDSGGATSSCTFTATVLDVEDPVIDSVTPSPGTLWPPNHKMVPVRFAVDVEDNCDASPACAISAVASNEPVNGRGDGNTSPDWEVLGPYTVNLRAERSGRGSGRIYTNTMTCEDTAGNDASATAVVRVPHDQR